LEKATILEKGIKSGEDNCRLPAETLRPKLGIVPAPAGSGSIAVDPSPGGVSAAPDGKLVVQIPADHAALILNAVPSGTIIVEPAGYPLSPRNVTVVRNPVVQVNADLKNAEPGHSRHPDRHHGSPGTGPAPSPHGDCSGRPCRSPAGLRRS